MKQFAILLALLALPAVVGCTSSSDAKSASASKKKKKSSKKPKVTADPHGKGYKPPQNVWGPMMREGYLDDLKSSDPIKREAACNGLFNQRSGAREALPELKKLLKSEKNEKVRAAARRAIKAIEEG